MIQRVSGNSKQLWLVMTGILVPSGDLVSEMAIFVLAVTFVCFELNKNFIKEKICGTNRFYSKFFLFFGNFDIWPRYGQKAHFGLPVLDYPYLLSGTCTKSEN